MKSATSPKAPYGERAIPLHKAERQSLPKNTKLHDIVPLTSDAEAYLLVPPAWTTVI